MNDEIRSYLEEKFAGLATKADLAALAKKDELYTVGARLHEGIESLSVMTARSFGEVTRQLDGIEERLDAVKDVHVGNLANRIEKLEKDCRELVAAFGR